MNSDADPGLIALMSVRDLQVLFTEAGIPVECRHSFLTDAGLPAELLDDSHGFADPTRVWRFCSSLGATLNDEHFGLASRPVASGTTDLLVARAMHGRNLGDAMNAWCAAANLILPDMHFVTRRRLDELRFGMSFRDGYREARQILLEISAIPYHETFRWLTGAQLPVRRFRTARARPSRATHLLAVFGCPIHFEGDGIEIVYPREAASLPLVPRSLGDWRTGIYPMFREDLERRRAGFTNAALAEYVELAMRSGITDRRAIAASAGMSEASLRRKLAAERTSFRMLRDRVLADAVRQHLDSGATVEEIADRLGYADARSFRRAFQRVVGTTPANLRARLRGRIGGRPRAD